MQQDYRNGPETTATVGSQLGAFLAIFPALALYHDEKVMLISLFVECILYVVIGWTVLPQEPVADRDPTLWRAALAYGLPLMVNGLGLVVMSQLDRVVVGNLFGLDTLALYSLVSNMALMPLSPLSVIIGNLALAHLTRSNRGGSVSEASSLAITWSILVLAAIYSVGTALTLDLLVPLIYGNHYRVPPSLHAMSVIVVFLRFCRQGPTDHPSGSRPHGSTAFANLIAASVLGAGYMLGAYWQRLDAFVPGLVFGEVISSLAIFLFVRRLCLTEVGCDDYASACSGLEPCDLPFAGKRRRGHVGQGAIRPARSGVDLLGRYVGLSTPHSSVVEMTQAGFQL